MKRDLASQGDNATSDLSPQPHEANTAVSQDVTAGCIQPCVCITEDCLRAIDLQHFQDKPLCVHYDEMPVCSTSRQSILKPVIASDGCIYDEDFLETLLRKTNISVKAKKLFPNKNHIPVRMAVSGEISSKLDERMKFSALSPLVTVFRSSTNNHSVVILVERQTDHGTGNVIAYRMRFAPGSVLNSKALLEISQVDDFTYAQSDTKSLLQRYDIDPADVRAVCYRTSLMNIVTLDRLAQQDLIRVKDEKILYCYRAEKALFSFYALFSGIQYHNACSWARNVLKQAGILTSSSLNYDRGYHITGNRFVEFFKGATPDQIMPLTEKVENTSTAAVSHSGK